MTEAERIMLIETEQRSKANSHRIDALVKNLEKMNEENKAIYKIATSVEVMAEKLGSIEAKVDETAIAQHNSEEKFLQRIAEVENAPAVQTAKNVNEIRLRAITAVVTFIITGALGVLIYFAK